MAVGDAHVFPGFLTQFSFHSHRLLFLHASEVRGEYTLKKVCLHRVSNSQPPGHESDTLTTEPPERAELVAEDFLGRKTPYKLTSYLRF